MNRTNANGDWSKSEKFAKEYVIQSKVAEELIKDLVVTLTKMEEIAISGYQNAEVVDALFLDSPLGHQKLWHSVECQFKKLGYAPLSRGIFTPVVDIKDLSVAAAEACKWLLKLNPSVSKKNEKAF